MISNITNKILSLRSETNQKILVVGVDGPTAAGKTIFAKSIYEKLQTAGHDCYIYQLDWTLKERADRVQDLSTLNQEKSAFPYEANLHMRLEVVEDFLVEVRKYNQNLNSNNKTIDLEGLYDRSNNGLAVGKSKVNLKPGLIVLLEGHYTLQCNLDRYIDYNILLLSEPRELLRRKIDRVKGYRSTDAAEDYFWRIDMPSFNNHMQRFAHLANITINNTDYLDPEQMTISEVQKWVDYKDSKMLTFPTIECEEDLKKLFSESELVDPTIKTILVKTINMVKQWDASCGEYLRLSIDSLDSDLHTLTNNYVKELNNKNLHSSFFVKICHTDAFYNVYNRKLPLTLSLGIYDHETSRKPEFSLICEAQQHQLKILIVWQGFVRYITYKRSLGSITTSPEIQFQSSQVETQEFLNKNPIRLYLPTDFTIPEFLRNTETERIYIGKESDSFLFSSALETILKDGGALIARFAYFSEIHFFSHILNLCGIPNMQAGSYLIALKCHNESLKQSFKDFMKDWEQPLKEMEDFIEARDHMDSIILEELLSVEKAVENYRHFKVRDGYLFSDFMYSGDKTSMLDALDEIEDMMHSPLRLLRKQVFRFLQNNFPGITLACGDLWNDLPDNAEKEITLQDYHKINPSIMAEVMLWMSLRGDTSAILGANIYDIRDCSIDATAHLQAALNKNSPIILQSSLNASGQKEIYKGNINHGYLKLENGAQSFIYTIMNSARNVYLTKGALPPLFGIGLDHVASEQDLPSGRAKRFLNEAIRTGKLTHYVADGSSLFESGEKEIRQKSFSKMSEYSVSLTESLYESYLLDREICTGEMNYAGKEKGFIPDLEDIEDFLHSYIKALKAKAHDALLSRPALFVGNLGTTHHGEDIEQPCIHKAEEWKEGMKQYGFISPVLHGTTNSHRDTLQDASRACHKINVAGNFLEIFMKNLPEELYRLLKNGPLEPKKNLHLIRKKLEDLSDSDIKNLEKSLQQCSENYMDTIKSPKLSYQDNTYFQYFTYKYSSEHIKVIVKEVKNYIKRFRIKQIQERTCEKINYEFAASMIEVPEKEMKSGLTDELWNRGIRYFHIDHGDGRFITRSFSGLEKAHFLSDSYSDARLHVHLMTLNPHMPESDGFSLIQKYQRTGVHAIAIHPRAFTDSSELRSALNQIQSLGCKAGLVLETHDHVDQKVKQLIAEFSLDWIVVMGVPIGYGGQVFHFNTLNTIKELRAHVISSELDFLIEVDGGMTFETMRFCKSAGAQVFAGWSIVKGENTIELCDNISTVQNILRDEKS